MTRLPPFVRRWTAAVLGFLLSVVAYIGVAYLAGSNGGQWGAFFWLMFGVPGCINIMHRLFDRVAAPRGQTEPAGA